jgi:hypothetical protein
MKHSSKRLAGVTIAALIGVGLLVWRDSTPRDHTEGQPGEMAGAETDKTEHRRVRKGPRKPPPSARSPAVPVDEDDNPDERVQEADGLTAQERKLEEYHEHLDAIEDPNVDELTMLGEMAFDANEAEAAYDHYLEVIEEHTDHSLAPFALYKLAWAEYNLGDVDAAIDDMELMIEWSGRGKLAYHGAADLELFTGERQYKSPHSPGG